jgi:hypothetical protein
MNLADRERNGWLIKHKTSPSEIRDLLAVVDRDLRDTAAEAIRASSTTIASSNRSPERSPPLPR